MMKKSSSICMRSIINRNLSTRITEKDDFGCETYSGFGMEQLESQCKILSLKKSRTNISRQKMAERNPIKKLEEKVEEMEKALQNKEKYFVRKLNKMKRKLQKEEEAQKQLTSEIKSLNLQMCKQTETLNALTKQASGSSMTDRKKKPKKKGKMFAKAASSRSLNKNSMSLRGASFLPANSLKKTIVTPHQSLFITNRFWNRRMKIHFWGIFALLQILYSESLALPRHEYTIETSRTISQGIREELLENIDRFANTTTAALLKSDLQNYTYEMVEIDSLTVNQIFSLFRISDPKCDKNKDDKISGSQLKCLNKIWKYYIPPEEVENQKGQSF